MYSLPQSSLRTCERSLTNNFPFHSGQYLSTCRARFEIHLIIERVPALRKSKKTTTIQQLI